MNHVAKYRAKAKLSQRALAALVGVSQQTIQRIEAEAQTVRYETAVALSAALKVAPKTLFPEMRPPSRVVDPPHRDETIDYSHSSHTLKMRFVDGLEKFYPVDAATARRVRSALVNGAPGFLGFDTDTQAVVVNCGKLLWTNVLFDPGMIVEEEEEQDDDTLDRRLNLYFDGESEPHSFAVDPDTADVADEEAEDGAALQWLLTMLESAGEDQETAFFTDADGEEVIFNVARLKIIEVPLIAVKPKLVEAVYAGMDEEEAAAEGAADHN